MSHEKTINNSTKTEQKIEKIQYLPPAPPHLNPNIYEPPHNLQIAHHLQ